MERETVASQEHRSWTVLGLLLGIWILVVVGQSMSEAEGWIEGWAWYLAGIDFFCVASRVGDGGEDETGRGEAESD